MIIMIIAINEGPPPPSLMGEICFWALPCFGGHPTRTRYYICMYVYIYIERERIYIYIYYVYIYIYI